MHFNLVVLCGRLAAPIEIRTFASGSRYVRLLLTVRSSKPRHRIDVIPVTFWDPPDDLISQAPEPGNHLWIAGSVQRRFWQGIDGRRSKVEIIAEHVERRDATDDDWPVVGEQVGSTTLPASCDG